MTLVAATLAWFAVQRQIKAQEVAEERATQRSTEQKTVQDAEAKYAAVIVLTQTVHAAAAALALAEWKERSIYRGDQWWISRIKCVPGDYVPKERI
jgi:hypothetical protein